MKRSICANLSLISEHRYITGSRFTKYILLDQMKSGVPSVVVDKLCSMYLGASKESRGAMDETLGNFAMHNVHPAVVGMLRQRGLSSLVAPGTTVSLRWSHAWPPVLEEGFSPSAGSAAADRRKATTGAVRAAQTNPE